MAKIILDTNVLLQHPELLARRQKDDVYILAPGVMNEFLAHVDSIPNGKAFLKFIERAIQNGHVRLYSPKAHVKLDDPSAAVNDIISLAQLSKNIGDEMIIASDDAAVAHAAEALDLPVITTNQLKTRAEGYDAIENESMANEATSVVNWQRAILAVQIASGLIGAVVSIYLLIAFAKLPSTFWKSIAVIPVSLFFYIIRCRYKRSYGVAEYAFGFFVVLVLVAPPLHDLFQTPFDIDNWLKILAGVYVMVRGLDNIGKGMKGTRWEPLWTWIFGPIG